MPVNICAKFANNVPGTIKQTVSFIAREIGGQIHRANSFYTLSSLQEVRIIFILLLNLLGWAQLFIEYQPLWN